MMNSLHSLTLQENILINLDNDEVVKCLYKRISMGSPTNHLVPEYDAWGETISLIHRLFFNIQWK